MSNDNSDRTEVVLTMRHALRLVVLIAIAMVMAALVQGPKGTGTMDGGSTMGSTDTPLAAPAGQGCAEAPTGLFNPCATLDTRLVDDLRADPDPESRCLAADGVMTPARQCVDATWILRSEVTPEVWAELCDAPFPRSIDHSVHGDPALIIPAEFVILGGPNGEDVLAVDTSRALTPRTIA